jgi:hypothetical protein
MTSNVSGRYLLLPDECDSPPGVLGEVIFKETGRGLLVFGMRNRTNP